MKIKIQNSEGKTNFRSELGDKFDARTPKYEARNKFKLDSVFWIFVGFGFIRLRFVSDLVLRISDLSQVRITR